MTSSPRSSLQRRADPFEECCPPSSPARLKETRSSSGRWNVTPIGTGLGGVYPTVASTDLTIGTATILVQVAQVRISVGLDNVLYEITFVATTDLGNTVEAEGLLLVRDI